MKFLGYEIEKRAFQDNAVLLLENVESGTYEKFLSAIQSFYYPENPVLGKNVALAGREKGGVLGWTGAK